MNNTKANPPIKHQNVPMPKIIQKNEPANETIPQHQEVKFPDETLQIPQPSIKVQNPKNLSQKLNEIKRPQEKNPAPQHDLQQKEKEKVKNQVLSPPKIHQEALQYPPQRSNEIEKHKEVKKPKENLKIHEKQQIISFDRIKNTKEEIKRQEEQIFDEKKVKLNEINYEKEKNVEDFENNPEENEQINMNDM